MLSILNNFAHGYVAVPVALACREAGLFRLLDEDRYLGWPELVTRLKANSGHLRVAMRLLESLGWIERSADDGYRLGGDARKSEAIPPDAAELLHFSFREHLYGEVPGSALQAWLDRSVAGWGLEDEQLVSFLDGLIVLPLFLTLCQEGAQVDGHSVRHDLFAGLPAGSQAMLQAYFCAKRWGRMESGRFVLAEAGEFLRDRILNTGVVASYRPLLQQVGQVIFGDCRPVFAHDAQGHETHIDRTLNVIGSGFQHQRYFADMEEIILSIFDNDRFDEQPRYIADMGCGDGALLKNIYEVVRRSRRGQALAAHPLKLIGVDINQKSLDQTTLTLRGIEHQTIVGDIGDPQRLVDDLRKMGIPDPENILHVRTFLDHDRPFIAPRRAAGSLPGRDEVFVAPDGSEIAPEIAYQSLVEHLERWSSVVSKYGLLVLEVHSLPAQTVRAHMSSENLHFDAVQAFSSQLMTSAEQFLMAAANGGMFAHQDFVRNYPKTLPFTRITLNFLQRRDYCLRFARLDDLDALDELEDLCWDAKLRAPRAIIAQRIERDPAGQLVVEQGGRVVGVIYSQRLRRAEDVGSLPASEAHRLHVPGGPVVQLVSVNVRPELQDRKLGDQLLEFMLQRCAVLSGVTGVVGVTRCKDFAAHPGVALADYVCMRNEHGRLVDPVLRFHELHGAQIGRLVPGYRPGDIANGGFGVVVEYDVHRRQRKDGKSQPAARAQAGAPAQAAIDPQVLEQSVADAIKALLGPMRAAHFSGTAPLMEMGLDSADLLELSETIAQQLNMQLAPTFFFDHNTGDKVAAELRKRLAAASLPRAVPAAPVLADPLASQESEAAPGGPGDIAIIGMACRLPGGIDAPEGLWQLLMRGDSACGELPAGRWTWPGSIDPKGDHRGIDRGAFLDDIAGFDAEFFRISPREAGLMDPQQRMLLELSWGCIEDAGYAATALAGSRTGVFVGASGSDYQLLLNERGGEVEAHYGLATSMAVLPNRLSYFYDFNGPSMQLDTACSSALVAVHAAVQGLRGGTCEQALVGAINLMCHPANTLAYYRAGMLAKDGNCKTFDASADGYVRGEGAIMVMLKPLARAIADGDTVHAVIKGGAVNHGGQAGGLTVPHPGRQAELLLAAWSDAGVPLGEAGYLEAHGTGTPLGDPIEVSGIKRAMIQAAEAGGTRVACGLGSVKTVLGHLEAAAGLAGLLKVVLSMRHQRLPATLHFQQLNPKIDLSDTGCRIVNASEPWAAQAGLPRYAGVSSFGSGGTNAHVVLQEFAARATHAARSPVAPALVPLSARTAGQLREMARGLLRHLEAHTPDMAALAYTLQVGRVAMSARVAFVAADQAGLMTQLASWLETGAGAPSAGQVADDEDLRLLLPGWIAHGRLDKLADAWMRGATVDWNGLYGEHTPNRISLPTYRFARERHWLAPSEGAAPTRASVAPAWHTLHPLLHANTSNLQEQRYSTFLSGDEYFLADHVVAGRRVLPAVAQLEMAREAVCQALGVEEGGLELDGVTFVRPVVVDAAMHLHIALDAQADGSVAFEIFSEPDGEDEAVMHSQGTARVVVGPAPAALDLARLDAQCPTAIEAAPLYAGFADMGLAYGPAMRAIRQAAHGSGQDGGGLVVARLALPSQAETDAGRFRLNPSLFDACLQAALRLLPEQGAGRPALPFAIERLRVFQALPAQAVAVVRRSADSGNRVYKFDIDVCAEDGSLCAQLSGYSSRLMESAAVAGALLFAPEWADCQPGTARRALPAQHIILLCEAHGQQEAIAARLPGARCIPLGTPALPAADRYAECAQQLLAQLRQIMLDKPEQTVLLQVVVAVRGEASLLGGLAGMLKTASLENDRVVGQTIAIGQADHATLAERLLEARDMDAAEMRFLDGRRQVRKFVDAAGYAAGAATLAPWRDGGVYLITGGTGALGLMFAAEIARRVKQPTLVLTARSPLGESQRARMLELVALGARVEFKQVDVSDRAQVDALVAATLRECGALHGIVHAAGVLRDGFIMRKSAADLAAVLAPKTAGLVNLDEASRGCELECFLLFSSISAALGNVGQADYAAANGFMDAYAGYRNSLVANGARHGRTLALNWPLWAEGGMGADAGTAAQLWHSVGMRPMGSAHGIDALYRAWTANVERMLVAEGDRARLRAVLDAASATPAVRPEAPADVVAAGTVPTAIPGDDELPGRTETYLTQLLSSSLKLPAHRIEAHVGLEAYGIDSMMVMELTRQLEGVFGTLPKTLFFEYQTIRALAAHLVERHRARLLSLLGGAESSGTVRNGAMPAAAR